MKKQLTVLIMFFSMFIASILAQATEQLPVKSLVVITDNRHPLHNVDAVRLTLSSTKVLMFYNLDDVNALEKHISQGLPMKEEDARPVLLQRINSMGQDNFNTKLLNAYGGVFYAMKNRINRYPAIVFNDETVLFGVSDLQKALQIYQQWLKDQKVNNHE